MAASMGAVGAEILDIGARKTGPMGWAAGERMGGQQMPGMFGLPNVQNVSDRQEVEEVCCCCIWQLAFASLGDPLPARVSVSCSRPLRCVPAWARCAVLHTCVAVCWCPSIGILSSQTTAISFTFTVLEYVSHQGFSGLEDYCCCLPNLVVNGDLQHEEAWLVQG